MESLTPQQVVAELDRYVIGQRKAKRAVAVALRNRWRRQQVTPEDLRDEILPKNIIMIGPTGVGKTEIARRLARLARAPFVKVEASKFTEVGYVGRDVESMVRDLTELGVSMVRHEKNELLRAQAEHLAEERLLDILLPPGPKEKSAGAPLEGEEERKGTREKLRALLHEGKLDHREVEIETRSHGAPMMQILEGPGLAEVEAGLGDMLGRMMSGRPKKRRVPISEALRLLTDEESDKLLDMERVAEEALSRVQQSGIVFIDEIDKIVGGRERTGPDVSREGVQRDLLPLVEGSTVPTKHGMVRTDHILFIAAGAFHGSSPSDLIPELQGRFPIRVELDSLGHEEFVRVLTEPENALIRQYQALLATEDVSLDFDAAAIDEIASVAAEVNQRGEDIGARRLQTVMTALLEDLLFDSPECGALEVQVTREMVRDRLDPVLGDEDLSRYIL